MKKAKPERQNNLLEAAKSLDWQQVRLNGGPACFHLEESKFCLRAQRWAGHDSLHKFCSLEDLIVKIQARS